MKTNIERFWRTGIAGLAGTALAMAIVIGAAGCKHNTTVAAQENGADPAAANMAPADQSDYSPDYPQQAPAPVERANPDSSVAQEGADQAQGDQYAPDDAYDTDVDNGEAALEETDEAPPELPEYDQPPAPDPDYLWTPGYWGWGPVGYYWVPGVWVAAPYAGALWTPGYWYFYGGGHYRWHHGYWGRHVGYYGGIDYGFGYIGVGYYGGYWNGPHFYYNTSVTRVNRGAIRNVYIHPAPRPVYGNYVRVAFTGGTRGVPARPRPAEVAAMREHHTPAMTTQVHLRQQAAQNRAQAFNQNHGRPQTVVAARPLTADRNVAPPPAGRFNPRINSPRGNDNNRNRGDNGNRGDNRNRGDDGQALRNAQEQERLQQQNLQNMRLQPGQGSVPGAPQNRRPNSNPQPPNGQPHAPQQANPQPPNMQPHNNVRERIPAQNNQPPNAQPRAPQQANPQPPNMQPPNMQPHNNVRERIPAQNNQQPPNAQPRAPQQANPQPQNAQPHNFQRPADNHNVAPVQRPAPESRPAPMMRQPQPQSRPAPSPRPMEPQRPAPRPMESPRQAPRPMEPPRQGPRPAQAPHPAPGQGHEEHH